MISRIGLHGFDRQIHVFIQSFIQPGVLNLLVLAYSQIKIVPLYVPPNQNCTPMRTTKSKLYPNAYHQIKITPLCVPPNKTCIPSAYPSTEKFYPKKLHLSVFFLFCVPPAASSSTPCGLFTYPYRTPRGPLEDVPQVENRCCRIHFPQP